MATELAKAYVQIIPSAQGIKGKLTSALGGEASSAGDAAGKTAGSSMASAIKKVVVAAGIGTALKKALSEAADLQQSLGGIETLFGTGGASMVEYAEQVGKSVSDIRDEYNMLMQAQDLVKQNANAAYKSAGLSANAYMETVTSFAASLKQSTETELEAAKAADQAIVDMSDNANKMGTSMELIQNAYQGFAKQNYTMLDNLKLGYGGTKEEMNRLLADAQKISGIEYDISSLSDVYEAIHVIQTEMGITGTTSKEAASTFSGSLAAMKAAGSNLLANLALGESIGPSLEALNETVFVFLKDNLLPMIGNIFSNLPVILDGALDMALEGLNFIADNAESIAQMGIDLVTQLIAGIIAAIPSLASAAVELVAGLGTAIINTDWLGVATDILTQLRDSLSTTATEVLGVDGSIVNSVISSVIDKLPDLLAKISDVFTTLWDVCVQVWNDIGQPIFDAICSVMQYLSDNWDSISASISTAFQTLWDVASTIWTTIGQPIWDMISFAIGSLADLFAEHMPAIMTFFQNAIDGIKDTWENHLKPVFEAIGKFLNDYVKPAFEFVWKAIVEPLIESVFGTIGRLWNNSLKPIFDGICDFLLGVFTNDWEKAFSGIISIVTGIWNGLVEIIQKPIDMVKDIINGAVEYIQDKFDFEWSLPKLKLPHFSITGSFSLNPLSVPSFGIDWYAKAMDNPMIMNSPTAFGINSLGQIMAGGEAGSEVVSGTDTLMRMIAEAVASQNEALLTVLVKILETITGMDENIAYKLREALEGLGIVLNDREFARLVKAVK